MKHTLYTYFIVTLFLLATACQRMSEQDVAPEKPTYTLTAILEGKPDTKTVLSAPDESGIYYPYWSKGDALALYADGINSPDTYSLISGEGTATGSFKGVLTGSHLVALYPASDKTDEGLKGNVLTLELPATQQYETESFGPGAYPMLAVSDDGTLSFKNLCAVLKISLTGNESVNSIKFIANDSWAAVSGKATVRTDFTTVPELVMSDDASPEVTLKCGSVDLDPSVPTDFFIVIPAGTYHGGFSLEIKTFNGTVTRSTSKDITFERSQFRAIPAFNCEGTGEIDPDYLPYNQIWYKTTWDGTIDFNADAFDVAIVSNTYEDGWGKIVFDGPVKRIGDDVFRYYFTDVRLPDCVEAIGNYAFYSSNILSFRTPASLSTVGSYAFQDCWSLSKFYGDWATEDGLFILLDEGLLVAYALGGISDTVTLPEGTITVGSYLFGSDSTVKHFIVPEGVTTISSYVFDYSSLLQTVTLPSSLEKVGESFKHCTSLSEFLGASSFISSDGKALIDPNTAELITVVERDMEDYVIPDDVGVLTYCCFYRLSNLRSITFPNSLYNMYSGWMYECPNVEFFYGANTSEDHHCLVFYGNYLVAATPICPADYVVPTDMGITRIFYDVFSNNTTIEHLTIPDEVYTAQYCFQNMSNLKTIRLSSDLQILGWDPFYGDHALEAVYLRSFTPPSFSESEGDYYKWGTDDLVIYVPKGFEDQYRSADGWSKYADRIQGFVYEDLEDPDWYISTDYTHDGEVTVLQTASEGEGINLVLMGDAYSDRQIADGTYMAAMRKMMDAFFSEEPYTTYQNLFNVYAINVVSATEGYDHGGQSLSTWFGDGTAVGGDDQKCAEYAQNVVPSEKIDNTLIIVAMNRDYYAGTCWMYYPSSGDYGCGMSVAYFPTSSDEATFNGLVRHEAGGHGFSKLGDEYAYESMGQIPQAEIESAENMATFGWWKNVDFTGDPEQVKWSKFLYDERYQYDGLGCFEGAFTYWRGAWRPTDNSIMRYNTDGFNAPSREAIWYRMHKLAYGNTWEYNYEDFVAYDAKNRKTASGAPARARRNYVERPMEPTHAPVVVPRRWNDPVPDGKKYSPASVTPSRPAPDTFGPETERRYCTKDFQ